ncbi:hypothetical protein [Synechococcus sp. CBW1107]|uniref:hypothetical protein n=1 Tax=Synechococcus sp. CBW1107 TaxID=2789857 RepID=UPI003A0FE540
MPRSLPHHAEAIADMALEMLAIIPRFSLDGAAPLTSGSHPWPQMAAEPTRKRAQATTPAQRRCGA